MTAPIALASPNAPAIRPACANDPVSRSPSSRIASANMPIGSEPRIDAATGAGAPGSVSTER